MCGLDQLTSTLGSRGVKSKGRDTKRCYTYPPKELSHSRSPNANEAVGSKLRYYN
jgi:hypothetical protein